MGVGQRKENEMEVYGQAEWNSWNILTFSGKGVKLLDMGAEGSKRRPSGQRESLE